MDTDYDTENGEAIAALLERVKYRVLEIMDTDPPREPDFPPPNGYAAPIGQVGNPYPLDPATADRVFVQVVPAVDGVEYSTYKMYTWKVGSGGYQYHYRQTMWHRGSELWIQRGY